MMGFRDVFLYGFLLPLRILFFPRRGFSRLRSFLDEYGLYGSAFFYFGAWLSVSVIVFFSLSSILFFRDVSGFGLGVFTVLPRVFVFSFGFPVIALFFDSLLMIFVLYFFSREKPLYRVFAVRASSLLPYGLRVVVLGYSGRLSFESFFSLNLSVWSLVFVFLGVLLTVYGLKRVLGVGYGGAVIAGLAPFLFKVFLSFVW